MTTRIDATQMKCRARYYTVQPDGARWYVSDGQGWESKRLDRQSADSLRNTLAGYAELLGYPNLYWSRVQSGRGEGRG